MERTDDFDKADWPCPGWPSSCGRASCSSTSIPMPRRSAPTLDRLHAATLQLRPRQRGVSGHLHARGDLPWNWKVMFENFNDGYHANRLHQFVQDFCPSSMTGIPGRLGRRLERDLPHGRLHAHRRRVQRHPPHDHAGLPRAHRRRTQPFDLRTRFHRRCASAPLPTSASSSSCGRAGPDTIDVEIGYLFHPSALDDPLFEQKLQLSRRRRPGVRPAGPGRDHQGPARPALTLRATRSLLVAGGEPRPVQPVVGPALPPPD